ncbi:hypothetical protein X975_02753, partial [Stegodyphus mimosarum]
TKNNSKHVYTSRNNNKLIRTCTTSSHFATVTIPYNSLHFI